MTRAWREHAEAVAELRAAVQWYESKRAGWGDVFIDAVDAAIESILDTTVSWGFYLGRRGEPQVYSRSIAGFPFDILFLLLDGVVIVIAYAHERRRPGYWEHRLEG